MSKKVAIYPGSFDPWHQGHTDVLLKALKVFDEVIVAKGTNPDKAMSDSIASFLKDYPGVVLKEFDGFLVDFVKQEKASAVIRGLRNGQDLEFERANQYWNEDLGMHVPVFYIICDRNLVHISSSALRSIKKIQDKKK